MASRSFTGSDGFADEGDDGLMLARASSSQPRGLGVGFLTALSTGRTVGMSATSSVDQESFRLADASARGISSAVPNLLHFTAGPLQQMVCLVYNRLGLRTSISERIAMPITVAEVRPLPNPPAACSYVELLNRMVMSYTALAQMGVLALTNAATDDKNITREGSVAGLWDKLAATKDRPRYQDTNCGQVWQIMTQLFMCAIPCGMPSVDPLALSSELSAVVREGLAVASESPRRVRIAAAYVGSWLLSPADPDAFATMLIARYRSRGTEILQSDTEATTSEQLLRFCALWKILVSYMGHAERLLTENEDVEVPVELYDDLSQAAHALVTNRVRGPIVFNDLTTGALLASAAHGWSRWGCVSAMVQKLLPSRQVPLQFSADELSRLADSLDPGWAGAELMRFAYRLGAPLGMLSISPRLLGTLVVYRIVLCAGGLIDPAAASQCVDASFQHGALRLPGYLERASSTAVQVPRVGVGIEFVTQADRAGSKDIKLHPRPALAHVPPPVFLEVPVFTALLTRLPAGVMSASMPDNVSIASIAHAGAASASSSNAFY